MTAPRRSAGPGTGSPAERRPLRPQQVIDYALARRATLAALFHGRASSLDVCDSHPHLLRAAHYYGEPVGTPCPVCRRGQQRRVHPLTHVTYVYGDMLGAGSGRPRAGRDLDRIARLHPGVRVYVVEVCQVCSWNHLVTSYVLGESDPPRKQPRARREA